jgi:dihydropyrimidinase
MSLDLAIRGGQLVTASDTFVADLGIDAGRIVQVGGTFEAAREIDAAGKLVLPGGVDAHVHLSQSSAREPNEPAWVDDFLSGSRAALAGGVTTVGNMSFPLPDELPLGKLERETALAQQQTIADVFLHPVLGTANAATLAEIPRLLEHGCSSIKIFLPSPSFDAYSRGNLEAIRLAGAHGLISMLHCEDFAVLEHAAARLVEAGQTALRYFSESRPVLAEVVATQRAVAFAEATGAPVYIVHLSSARALEVCTEARARGVPVFVETRPLYLHLTSERFLEDDHPKYVGQPPLRSPADRDALWAALSGGQIQTVCTDHAPWSLAAKLDPSLSISRLRPGVENLQTLLPMLYSEGVRRGRISLQRLVQVTSTNAARLFGLHPRKGSLAVGSDADVVIFDPELTRTIDGAMLESNADYSVYGGWQVTGWPVVSIRRGEIVYQDGQILGQPGTGHVLSCGPAEALSVV